MCKYFGYFLSVWALGLGTFYAYMLYDVINSIRGLSGPLSAFQTIMGPSNPLGNLPDLGDATTKSVDSSASLESIYEMINDNMKDEKKRDQYLREFLPDIGLEEQHYKEMNKIMENFKFEKLKEYLDDLSKYVRENVKNEVVRKKALVKLDEFKANTADIDESIGRLASHMAEKQEL